MDARRMFLRLFHRLWWSDRLLSINALFFKVLFLTVIAGVSQVFERCALFHRHLSHTCTIFMSYSQVSLSGPSVVRDMLDFIELWRSLWRICTTSRGCRRRICTIFWRWIPRTATFWRIWSASPVIWKRRSKIFHFFRCFTAVNGFK